MEALRGCFKATEWILFVNDQDRLNNYKLLNDTIASYVNFWADSGLKTKEVRIYTKNKPCVNKELKHHLNLKKKGLHARVSLKNRMNQMRRRMTKKAQTEYMDGQAAGNSPSV